MNGFISNRHDCLLLREIIAKYNVKAFRATDVRKHGIEKITQMAIEAVSANGYEIPSSIHCIYHSVESRIV